MGSEASGGGRQVKQIRVLFAICHRSVPRSERFSALSPLLRQNQLAQNRLVGAFGRVSRSFRLRTARSSPATFCPACRRRPRL